MDIPLPIVNNVLLDYIIHLQPRAAQSVRLECIKHQVMRDEDDNTATNNTRPRSNTANLNDYELESTLETIAALSLQNKNLIKKNLFGFV